MSANLMITLTAPMAAGGRTDGSSAGKASTDSLFAGLLGQAMQAGDAPQAPTASGTSLASALWFTLPAAGQEVSPGLDAIAESGNSTERLLELLAGLKEGETGEAGGEALLRLAEWLAALFGTTTLPTGTPAIMPAAGETDTTAADWGQMLASLTDAADAEERPPLADALRRLLGSWERQTDGGEPLHPEWARLVGTLKAALQGQPLPDAAEDAVPHPGTTPAIGPETDKPIGTAARAASQPANERAEPRVGWIVTRHEGRGVPMTDAVQRTAPAEGDTVPMPAANRAEQTAVSGLPSEGEAVPVWMLRDATSVHVNAARSKEELPQPVPVRQLAEQLGAFLVKKLTLHRQDGVTEARITLHPEHLGHVDIRLTVRDGQLTAQFLTQNGMAKELLETQMAQLRTALQGHGLQVERMEVVQQTTFPSTSAFLQQQDRHPGSGDGRRRTAGGSREDVYGEAVDFDAAMERSALLHDVYGSSINLTA